jgi:Flp pilus assembly protein TadD
MTRRLFILLSCFLLLPLGACASRATLRKADADGRALRLQLAQAYVAKGAYDAALPLVRQTAQEYPRSAHVRMLYATVLRERGLYPQAEREFLAAIRLAPKHAPSHAGLGILYDLMQRSDEAIAEHRTSIQLAKENAPYWNNLGFSLLVDGQTEEAVPVLEKALALDPSITVAYNNLGFAYGRQGRFDDALRAFRAAVGEAGAYLNLAYVYDETGDATQAERYRTLAYRLVPELEKEPTRR